MFIALPGLYGAATSALTEQLIARGQPSAALGLVALTLPLVALSILGFFGPLLVVTISAGWLLNRRIPLVRWWHSRPVTIVGRTALATACGFALFTLVGDSLAIL